ncbi:dipeptidase PepV [Granulicatella seriolae]|uniref:Dipeptidase PepV n=1 Tax=Granulicatella seriolae TaxID=2967226 RepID=A0ABT1WL98_9LACT|nr:dipeptidase PepV [Granulicatella seriolae]
MEINWKKEIEDRKEDLLADLFDLLRIDSVRNDELANEDQPVGPGPKEALEKFLAIAERDGFVTKQVGNLAGHIEYAPNPDFTETLGVLGHVDVVPAGTGWNTDPFEPQIIDGKIFARGSSDDKGPSMAAYYALKVIKDLGLPLQKRVRFIIGTDEESGWKCMDRYFKTEEMPTFGFSPDAEFPIINGEKGIVSLHLETHGNQPEGDYRLLSFDAGLRENMVPQDAHAEVLVPNPYEFADQFQAFLAVNPILGTVEVNDNLVVLDVIGKSAHGSHPEAGVNAGTYLAVFLNGYNFQGTAKKYLDLTARLLHDDPFATKLKLAYTDSVMGPLTMNAGIFTYTPELGGTIVLNFRFPQGLSAEGLEIKTEIAVASYGMTVGRGKTQTPHYVSPEDPLVSTLLDVYHRQTGLPAHEQSIGGGTYGRIFERGVAYGAMFPGYEDTMHQANEFMTMDDLLRSAAIYAEAIYELTK